jgi:hypothetical protein
MLVVSRALVRVGIEALVHGLIAEPKETSAASYVLRGNSHELRAKRDKS